MTRIRRGAAMLLLCLPLAAAACGGKGNTATNGREKKITNVSVAVVSQRTMVEKTVLSGQVFPNQEVLITAEAGGVAERIIPKKGSLVNAGDLLAEINRLQSKTVLDRAEAALRQTKLAKDEADLGVKRSEQALTNAQIQVQQAGLALKQAEKMHEKAQIGLSNQRNHFERIKKLYQEKLVAQSAHDDAQAALRAMEADFSAASTGVETAREGIRMAESNLAQARLAEESARLRIQSSLADIQSAEAALAQARLHYDKGQLTAPFDAAVDDIFFEPGEFVKIESPVFKLIKTNPVKVKASLAEKDIPFIKKGQPAEIAVSSLPGSVFNGDISFVALSADPRTNTYAVEIVVPNPRGELKAGMMAQVTLVRRRLENAVGVPNFSVIPKEDGEVVFVLENGKAVRRKVVTGIIENGWIEIRDGLAAGENLIIKGQRDLQDGQDVLVQS